MLPSKRWKAWEETRSKGQRRYVLTYGLFVALAMICGRLFTEYFTTELSLYELLREQSSYIIFLFVLSPLFALLFWYIQEGLYQFSKKSK